MKKIGMKLNEVKSNKEQNYIKQNNGITLIALVLTIIVLLILAGISISMLAGQNGILTQAQNAKIETAISSVKEEIGLYATEKMIEKENVTSETLLAEGKVGRTVKEGEDNKYYMIYYLKEGAFSSMKGLGKGSVGEQKDVFLIDDNLNIKYIGNDGKEYGDSIEEKVLEDETEIRFSSKVFSEYISKISGVREENMKFKWMKNQTNLVITDSAVDSLQDLVFFPNLTSLQLGQDISGKDAPNIVSMNGIENCTKLNNLKIISGPNKDYTAIRHLQNLTDFSRLYGADINNIIDNLKFCRSLNSIYFAYTSVNMKRIEELANISILRLAECKIDKIEGIENKTNLTHLILNNNNITKIEGLTNLTNLRYIDLSSNKIKDITPLSMNESLKDVLLKGNSEIDENRENYTGKKLIALNKIEKILENGGNIYLDADKLKLFKGYKKLNLRNSKLTTLESLEGLTEVTYLDLSNTSVSLEDIKSQEILSNMKCLQTLILDRNDIKNISVINNLKSLKYLYLNTSENNNLKDIEDIISNLDELTVTNSTLQTIINCDANKIRRLNLVDSTIKTLPDLTKFKLLEDISLSGDSSIENFGILANLLNLKTLNLANNNLHNRMIVFSKLTNLTSLNLSNNNLWSEDLENLKMLKNNSNLTIDLRNNSIIDTSSLLELNSNTKINLSGNINLTQDSKDKLKAKFGNNVSF